jgi:hypothetical protein
MRAKSLFLLASGILLIVAGLLVFNAVQRRRRTEASLADLAAQRLTLKAELARMSARRVTAENALAELGRVRESPGPTPPAAGTTAGKLPASAERPKTMSEIIANEPKAEVLMLSWQRAVVLLEYGPFFRAHGLSPGQIQKFQDNWVRCTEQNMDLAAVARAQDAAGRQAINKLQAQGKADYEAAQQEVLGPDGWRQLQEYERTEVVRNVVVLGLAGGAALAGVPLTAQQGDQLWQAALNAANRDPKINGQDLVATIDWDALDAQAQQILSPEQLALFTTTAYPSGFSPRGKYQLDAVIRRALQADAAASTAKRSGG